MTRPDNMLENYNPPHHSASHNSEHIQVESFSPPNPINYPDFPKELLFPNFPLNHFESAKQDYAGSSKDNHLTQPEPSYYHEYKPTCPATTNEGYFVTTPGPYSTPEPTFYEPVYQDSNQNPDQQCVDSDAGRIVSFQVFAK